MAMKITYNTAFFGINMIYNSVLSPVKYNLYV